jgi:integrase
MAVKKLLTCQECGKAHEVQRQERNAPPCLDCGGPTAYSDKWIVPVVLEDAEGYIAHRFDAYTDKKAEARALATELRKPRMAAAAPVQSASFASLADAFKVWCETKVIEGNLAKSSEQYYLSRLNANLLPYFGSWDAEQITEEAVEIYRLLRLKLVKPASVNREIATLKRMMSLAARRRKIDNNPLAGMEMLKENNKRERVLTPEEVKKLLAECSKISGRCYVATVIALNTGLRKDGVVSLKWSEIDLEATNCIKKRVKGGKIVTIPLSGDLRAALIEWHKCPDTDRSGYVLPSPRKPGTHMLVSSNFGFATACKMAGVGAGFHFHDLRHSFATYFIRETRDLHLTAKLLGHTSTRITERYSHLVNDQAAEAMKGFSMGAM